jgi:hypothetical protein
MAVFNFEYLALGKLLGDEYMAMTFWPTHRRIKNIV